MAKLKSIYPLQGIFNNLLVDTNKSSFLIPTYQRGYKWSSLDGKGQVDILLRDLYGAYSSRTSRYFLQFLTLQEHGDELEVIDGQQRLTTLTILFCVISYLLKNDDSQNFVIGKLKYQTRQNFIKKYIYEDISTLINSNDWEAFRATNPDHDNQDVYFIFHAVKAIHRFLLSDSSTVKPFFAHLCENVYLIVNLLDKNLNSERVFLNVNKGVKLNDEDLVKGLLITKLPLDLLCQKVRATEVEINELRTNMGRQWDDLSSWAYREDVRSFFKSDTENARIDWLIRLTYPEIDENDGDHKMFSYFNNLYTHHKIAAEDIFNSIRKTKMMLNDWFNEPETCNLLGFLLNANDSPKKEILWSELSEKKTKAGIITHLKSRCLSLLPLNKNQELLDLSYESDKKKLFNVFLILDIMKFLPINGRVARPYDFRNISAGTWSLEHIFPQNAQDFRTLDELTIDDLNVIKQFLNKDSDGLKSDQVDDENSLMQLYNKIFEAKSAIKIGKDEKNVLAKLLKYNAPELHNIGNLALLLSNMNSSLSNHFFNRKREILVKKISEGKFVPFHTYDVFSKLIIKNNSDLHEWTKDDIVEHGEYIRMQIKNLIKYLNPQS